MKRLFSLIVFVSIHHLVSGQIDKVEAVGITVGEMQTALDFYTHVLSFEKISDEEIYGDTYEDLKGLFGIHYRKVKLRLGDEFIELTDFLTPGGRIVPVDSRSNDLWFQHIAIVVSNMDSAYSYLRKFGVVHVSTTPQTLPETIPAAAGVKAFYFRDPDDHNLELIYFPVGKGNQRWQRHAGKIFLGIDHTAIGISSTTKSRKFYNDLLGVKFQGESFNFGKEQEHLNNVSGARLHISGNRSSNGPGVEFLEYLTPNNGRPYPVDERTDDLIHWETIMITSNATQLYDKLKRSGTNFISKSIVSLPSNSGNYSKGFYVRDPDAHAIGIFQP